MAVGFRVVIGKMGTHMAMRAKVGTQGNNLVEGASEAMTCICWLRVQEVGISVSVLPGFGRASGLGSRCSGMIGI